MTRISRGLFQRTSLLPATRVIAVVLLLGIASGMPNVAEAQGELRKGQSRSGTLSSGDSKLDDGSFYDMWTYRAQAGETVKITLRSSDFDAYLAVGRMDGEEFASQETDDDSAGDTDAELKMTLASAGLYHIRVNSLSEGEKGAYTLILEEAQGARPAVPQGRLTLGAGVSGELSTSDAVMDDESHYDLWTYPGRSGETIRVTLKSSEFDAYLSVGQMENGEFSEIDSDDDGAGGTDARLVLTLSSDGEYLVRANSLSEGETGDYTLIVEQADPAEIEASDDHDHDDSEGEGEAGPLPEPTIIRAGQTLNGELSESDSKMGDDSHYDLYSFDGRRGQQVTVTMRSTAFDSYLALGQIDGGSFNALESDDDTGGGDDAQITYRITRDGAYVIRTNSLFANVTGEYSVRLEMGEAPPPVPVTMQPIRYGQTVNGELAVSDPQMDDDSHYDLWKFTGRQGEKLVITMKSTVFDTYVALGRMENGEFAQVESNDDGAGGTDSKIEYTLESDGEYAIRANSLFSKGLGSYTLNLARGR
jgi:hypothetical protein